jgi:phenylalanyl-tRNA synthetase beta chain
MKISLNWLKNYINVDLDPVKIGELLTDGGLEVESIETFETVKGGLNGLVVGEILTCEKHPDADRLKITTVNIGEGVPLNIVCGAPNARAGQKVIVATVGTKLYPNGGEPFEIKKSKIRGALSEGMLCAEDEIGLGISHDGIMELPFNTKVGLPASTYFNLQSDFIFEIGLTPNRTDAISHMGVARDLSALLLQRLKIYSSVKLPEYQLLSLTTDVCPIKVIVDSVDLCPRYSGVYLTDVKVGESPKWLKTALESIGLRSINNIVDITNYVMHETGQPLHAFDADKIKGNTIKVTSAKEGTKFTTLDGVERILKSNHLVICNAEEPMCIAGVFGGEQSGVNDKTVNVFLESAHFNAASVRKTARELQLKTDSSFRFERGTDPNHVLFALKRAAYLICSETGAKTTGNIIDHYPFKIEENEVSVSYTSINKYIGKNIDSLTVKNILNSLGIKVKEENNDTLLLSIPTYKTDVTQEADIVEEVLRIYGYNNVEIPAKINASVNYTLRPQPDAVQNRISDFLSYNGFAEMMSLSLTKDQLNKTTETYNQNSAVELLNPVSNEVNMLRQHLLTGTLQAISFNINRKQRNLKFYEFGKVYFKTENGFNEEKHLALSISGEIKNDNWQKLSRKTDFFYLKESVYKLFNSLGVNENNLLLKEIDLPYYSYALGIEYNQKQIGCIGKIKDSILKKLDIDQEVYFADILWDDLMKMAKKAKVVYQEISKFPEVKRDLALLVDKTSKYEDLYKLALQADKKLIKQVNLFDIYEGDKLPAGKKSYALSFTILDEQATLTDKVIEKTMDKVLKILEEKAGAKLRA